MRGRAWFEVELRYVSRVPRPESQGGEWLLGQYMRVIRRHV
jgi:hypothetical protein